MSEFEQLIDLDFASLNMEQFRKMLKLIFTEAGRDRALYYDIVQCKILAEIYKELKT